MTKSDKALVKSTFKLALWRLGQLVSFLIGTGLCAFVVFHAFAFK